MSEKLDKFALLQQNVHTTPNPAALAAVGAEIDEGGPA